MGILVVAAGDAVIANRLHGAGTEPVFIGWGTATGTTAKTDTTLFTETTYGGYARVTGTASLVTTTFTNDTWQVVGTLTNSSGGSLTITNAGCFDAATAGNLFVKADSASFPGGTTIALNNGDAIAWTIKVQFS